jgi:hypothetical protein
MFNCALFGNSHSHYMHERDVWWKVVVDSKFGILWVDGVLMSLLGQTGWAY